jgi:hypothetical protein
MSFADLVAEHYLPTYEHASPIDRKNLASHLADGNASNRSRWLQLTDPIDRR